jgi:hypothetical protein
MRCLATSAITFVLLASLVSACGEGPERARQRAIARQAAIDPPELWSAEVLPVQPGVAAVTLCTDSRIREGLARPALMLAQSPCRPVGEPVKTETGEVQRCVSNGEAWMATSRVTGDRTSDFTATLKAVAINDDNARFEQVRRFRKLGACPEGWAIGETTDQSGQRHRPAIANIFQ